LVRVERRRLYQGMVALVRAVDAAKRCGVAGVERPGQATRLAVAAVEAMEEGAARSLVAMVVAAMVQSKPLLQ